MVGAGKWPRGREEVSLQPDPVQENPKAESKAAESLCHPLWPTLRAPWRPCYSFHQEEWLGLAQAWKEEGGQVGEL